MKKIVALNLKMNLDYEQAIDYISGIRNKISDKHNIVIIPSSIYLEMFKKSGYQIGAQNVYYLDKGSFTGEISPLQLKTMGISYVLVGHSERRIHFHEEDKLINEKIAGCLKHNLKVIFCIGETNEERRLRKTASILKRQLRDGLKDIDRDDLEDVIIAYEPVWAIGTGLTPRSEEIEDSITYIKKTVNKEFNANLNVLYGGSVDNNNIENIIGISNVDGVLIGSASIDYKNVVSMLDLID